MKEKMQAEMSQLDTAKRREYLMIDYAQEATKSANEAVVRASSSRGLSILALGLALTSILVSCATLKSAGRTINDAATVLCELFAQDADAEQLKGFTPSQYCAVHEHLEPFIDEALKAKNAAALRVQQVEAE